MRYEAAIYAEDSSLKTGRAKVGTVTVEAANMVAAVAEVSAQLSGAPEDVAGSLNRVVITPDETSTGLRLRSTKADTPKKGKAKK